MKKSLLRFSPYELIIISLFSACGIAIKPFVRILTQMVVGTVIPAGAVSGIIYMIWIVAPCVLVKKRGTAVLVSVVQAVLVIALDMLGNKGIANLLVYVLPGIALEVGMLLSPKYVNSDMTGFFAGMLANATGSLVMGAVFMRLPTVPLLSSVVLGSFSGGLGGVIGYRLAAITDMFRNVYVKRS